MIILPLLIHGVICFVYCENIVTLRASKSPSRKLKRYTLTMYNPNSIFAETICKEFWHETDNREFLYKTLINLILNKD